MQDHAAMADHTELCMSEADHKRQTQGRQFYFGGRMLPPLVAFFVMFTALSSSYLIVTKLELKPTSLRSFSRASVKDTVTVQEALQWASASWPTVSAADTVPIQRPRPDGSEDMDLSVVLQRWQVSSLNPPSEIEAADSALEYLELRSRLVIGIAMGVHSGSVTTANLQDLRLLKTTLPTLLPTMEPAYIYRLYLGYDDVDPLYSSASVRDTITAQVQAAVQQENERRPHYGDHWHTTPDATTLLLSLHWVPCNFTKKPAWAQNDAALAAFKEGADYVLRSNDDTKLPARKDWTSVLIGDLRGRKPIPNLGVAGPHCPQGNTAILTHDFTHRTHVLIHGFYYPRAFTTWYADDWVTKVYEGFDPPLMSRRMDVVVEHMLEGQRYVVVAPANISAVLQHELAKGRAAILDFLKRKNSSNVADHGK